MKDDLVESQVRLGWHKKAGGRKNEKDRGKPPAFRPPPGAMLTRSRI
jgi:hypothetical protein